ncbi:hypothetical protein Pfo_031501 [Paulownia fortunei]|nr:hypothetical protein Pfo_031501 [Paulownia fortunei]
MDFGVNFAPAETPTGDLLADGTLPALPDLFTDVLTELGTESAPNATIKVIPFETPMMFGDFEVTFFETDHDARGAAAIRVRDGTEFSFDADDETEHVRHTEMSVQQDFGQILDEHHQLVVINPYERNIDRLEALQNTARLHGREILWDKQFATIMRAMGVADVKEIDWEAVVAEPNHYVGEYDPRFAELQAYLDANHVELQRLGASGHAKPEDLVSLAQHVMLKILLLGIRSSQKKKQKPCAK